MTKLPNGWVECELKDVAVVKGGKRLPSGVAYSEVKTAFPYIRVTNFNNMTVNLNDIKYLTLEIQQKIKSYTISKDDVYISIAGSIGKAGTIPDILDGANLTENAAKIVHKINKDYLKYILNSNEVQYQMSFSTKSTTQPKLALYRIESLKIKLAPLNEQKRIVEKIENEFKKIDEGIEKLKSVKEQIKQYKQSVLKSAFDGKLYKTTEWEEKTLEEIASKITDGSHFSPKTVEKSSYPYVTVKDVHDDKINFENCKYISENDYNELLKNGCQPEPNDVLFSKDGTVGKVTLINYAKKFVILSSLAILRPNIDIITPNYLKWALKNPEFLQEAINRKTGVAIRRIILRTLKMLKIKYPKNIDEQKQIVKEIEKRFEVADKAARVIEENLEKAEQLKQSILKKAFEGRLVPQDPTDEPASVLLEKIKSERK